MSNYDLSGLSALFLNCTLKPTGTLSHTEKLMEVSQKIMIAQRVGVEILRPVDFDIPVDIV